MAAVRRLLTEVFSRCDGRIMGTGAMAPMRVLSTMGVAGVFQQCRTAWEAALGMPIEATVAPPVRLLEQIREGARADVAILTADGIDALASDGVLEGRTDLARSFVGVA